jgi:hypothetical protein
VCRRGERTVLRTAGCRTGRSPTGTVPRPGPGRRRYPHQTRSFGNRRRRAAGQRRGRRERCGRRSASAHHTRGAPSWAVAEPTPPVTAVSQITLEQRLRAGYFRQASGGSAGAARAVAVTGRALSRGCPYASSPDSFRAPGRLCPRTRGVHGPGSGCDAPAQPAGIAVPPGQASLGVSLLRPFCRDRGIPHQAETLLKRRQLIVGQRHPQGPARPGTARRPHHRRHRRRRSRGLADSGDDLRHLAHRTSTHPSPAH